MKLTYRGLSYDPCNQAVPESDTPVVARYRGIAYRSRSAQPVNRPTVALTYRGLPYHG